MLSCETDEPWVKLQVRDTGMGIAEDQLESIFTPFVPIHTGLTREAQGTGLGLTISREFARGMGGDLTVKSRPGEGSIFTVRLPLSVAVAKSGEAEPDENSRRAPSGDADSGGR